MSHDATQGREPAESRLAGRGGGTKIVLPPLPYPKDALEPYLSAETLETHYEKHHRRYFEKLEKLIRGTELEALSLPEIIQRAKGPTFNNAAQVWNHTFYWESMSPGGGSAPKGSLEAAIRASFGSFETLREKFTTAAVELFGSGYVWLCIKKGKIEIESFSNADNPIAHRESGLLCLDVWEHAYYLDHRNERRKFVDAFFDHLVSWDGAESHLAASRH